MCYFLDKMKESQMNSSFQRHAEGFNLDINFFPSYSLLITNDASACFLDLITQYGKTVFFPSKDLTRKIILDFDEKDKHWLMFLKKLFSYLRKSFSVISINPRALAGSNIFLVVFSHSFIFSTRFRLSNTCYFPTVTLFEG